MNDLNNPEYLDNTDPEKNHDYWRQDHGGMVTNHNGIADKLLKNNDLYNSMKGDWSRTAYNKSNNIKVTTGREDEFYRVVQQEYPQYVCYPGGKLPIPVQVSYPTKAGQQKFFKGH